MAATKQDGDNELDQMEIFEEDDVFDCMEFNDDENNNDTFNNNVIEIINGEIQLIDYALKKSVLYDLQQINSCKKKENKDKDENKDNVDNKEMIKYKQFHDSYQVIVELEISSSIDTSRGDVIIIGALIPKGYVVLSFNDKSNDENSNLIWYDSIHNLLLKTCKQYEKLATNRIQSQLASISTVKTD